MTIYKNQRKWWILTAMMVAMFMVSIDFTIVNLILAHIAKTFHVGISPIQWVANIFIFTLASLMMIVSKFNERFGHRNMFMVGILLFIVASIIAALSPNIAQLIIARALQGIGTAMLFSSMFIIVGNAFSENKRGRVVGYMVGINGFGQAVGPILGGEILHYLSWHWVFLINIPTGLLSLIIAHYACIKDAPKHPIKSPFDIIGALLLLLGLFSMLFSVNHLNNWGVNSMLFWGFFLGGCTLCGIVILWSRQVTHAILPLKIFKTPSFSKLVTMRFCFFTLLLSLLFFIPLILQNAYGFSPSQTGRIMIAMTALFCIVSFFGGDIIDKFKPERPMLLSALMITIAYIILFFASLENEIFLYLIGIAILGFSFALLTTASSTLGLTIIPEDIKGSGVGLFYGISFIGGAVGQGLLGSLFALISKKRFIGELSANTITLPTPTMHHLDKITSLSRPLSTTTHLIISPSALKIKALLSHAVFSSISIIWAICFVLSLIILLLCLIIKHQRQN